jgi:hypothetical protein
MATLQPQEGMIGLPIVYQVNTDQVDVNGDPIPRDISSFTTHDLIFQKPDRTVVVKTAEFFTDGSDGLLVYTTINGDLVPGGLFEVQSHLANADGSIDETTEVAIFHCNRNIPRPTT